MTTPVGEDHEPGKQPIAFGIERLGLIPVKAPAIALAVALIVAALAFFGAQQIKVDDSLSQLFHSDSAEFRQYEQVSKDFPSSEYDVLVVIHGEKLLDRDTIEKLRDLAADLQLVDGARGIISMFSAREPATEGGPPPPLFPDVLPEGRAYDELIDRATHNELIRGKLLSDDGKLALYVLSLKPEVADSAQLAVAIGDVRKTMADDLQGAPVSAELSGVPVMQLEIRRALEHDRILYNAIGFALGCVVAALFFRRASLMIIAAGPPLLAILFALGALGWIGFRLNTFLNVMTPLIMVISFSDSMQLTFAARDRLVAGDDKRTAFTRAVRIVGPACVLTHVAAGLSLAGLLISKSDLIREFGEAGIIATAVALLTVLSLVPVLGVTLIGDEARFVANLGAEDPGVSGLRRFCGWIAGRMVSRPLFYGLIGILVVAALGAFYEGLKPSYRLADQVPDKQQSTEASHRLDAELTGSNPLDVLIAFPADAGLYAPATLATIADVHHTLAADPAIGNVWSVETLRSWLADKMHLTGVDALKQYMDVLPKFLVRRFVSLDQNSAIVSGFVPDNNLTALVPIVDRLDKRLEAVRHDHPGYQISVTGLSVIAARDSASMIEALNHALTVEFVFVAILIGLAFRSFAIGVACLVPGLFPIFAAGSLLRALGFGLQFAGAVSLIVSFGLGLSATIHFLNRMVRERTAGEDPGIAVARATVLVGPALILTTLVLACGLAALVFSSLPALRLFGWLSAFAMAAALAADLLIFRPVITVLLRIADQGLRRTLGLQPRAT
ncbi:MAG: RND transporter [Bradyrhizobium sp.]|nr:MAG: RND transporter [Bradyrhizobium sp.]